MAEWTKETKTRLYQSVTPAPTTDSEDRGRKPVAKPISNDDEEDDRHSNASVGSTVVVSSGTDGGISGKDSPELVKVEPQ